MTGPLQGYRIVEVAALGPAPFAAMMLADMGADVIRVDRAQIGSQFVPVDPEQDVLLRGRRSVAVDLKHGDGAGVVLDLIESADALIEGFRPGVMERLGLGPQECHARNPRLVYGRMTGWGQDGPYAQVAGHDINYIALAGALAHFARDGGTPTPPLNLVGDFGGGGMFLAFGVVCGLLEAKVSGLGQVVDAAMVDGVATLMAQWWSGIATGQFDETSPGTNMIDSGSHFYEVYRCRDGRFISIGSVEPQFYRELLRLTDLTDDPDFVDQMNAARWPHLKARLQEVFATRTRDEWCDIMEGTNVCFAPVLTMSEAAEHQHNVARETFANVDGMRQPNPAPRFSRTSPTLQRAAAYPGQHTTEVLAEWGMAAERIKNLVQSGAVAGS